jgi:putative FmdB family regulatory protein
MPIYEYECENCGKIEEALQKVSDKPLKKCRDCSGKLHRLISQSTFHLKGTGWYVTDYADKRSGSASKENTQSKEAASPAKSKDSKEAGTATPAKTSD